MKFQRALFPEMEGRTIVVTNPRKHRCRVVWINQVTDDIRKKVRGLNSQLFVSMHTSNSEASDSDLDWEQNRTLPSNWI